LKNEGLSSGILHYADWKIYTDVCVSAVNTQALGFSEMSIQTSVREVMSKKTVIFFVLSCLNWIHIN
jgi:hypothetical protein